MRHPSKYLAAFYLCSVASLSFAQNQDPFLWLEDVTGEKALDWVKLRNQETRNKLDNDAGFQELRRDLQVILDSKDRIPGITKMGDNVYNFWTDGEHPRGVWRKTTLDEYRKTEPKWETVLDIDALAKAEKENWVFKNSQCREPAYDRCLIELSRGGADAVTLREFDLRSKQFVNNGFNLSESKMAVDWRDFNTVFVATDFGKNTLTESGYPRLVKEWKRGTPLTSAKLILEGKTTDLSVAATDVSHAGQHHEIVLRQIDFYSAEHYLREHGKLKKLDVPAQSDLSFFEDQLLITLREKWTQAGKTYPSGSVLAINFAAFKKGDRNFNTLFEPSDSTSFTGITATRHYLLLQALDNVKSNLK